MAKPNDLIEVVLRRDGSIANRAVGIPASKFRRDQPTRMQREAFDKALADGKIRACDIVSVKVVEEPKAEKAKGKEKAK